MLGWGQTGEELAGGVPAPGWLIIGLPSAGRGLWGRGRLGLIPVGRPFVGRGQVGEEPAGRGAPVGSPLAARPRDPARGPGARRVRGVVLSARAAGGLSVRERPGPIQWPLSAGPFVQEAATSCGAGLGRAGCRLRSLSQRAGSWRGRSPAHKRAGRPRTQKVARSPPPACHGQSQAQAQLSCSEQGSSSTSREAWEGP